MEKWDSNDIQMQHLRFHYVEEPDKPILEDLNLQVGAGKFIGIAGPSGCGKSTVTKAIDKLRKQRVRLPSVAMTWRRLPVQIWRKLWYWCRRFHSSSQIPYFTISVMG